MPYSQLTIEEYASFPQVANPSYLKLRTSLSELEGYQKVIMLDRYAFKDGKLQTLKEGDLVVVEVKPHPEYPTQGYGRVTSIEDKGVRVKVEYPESVQADDGSLMDLENIFVSKAKISKPLELYWEQICFRVARGAASSEKTRTLRKYWFRKFFWMLKNKYAIPGGRILFGAGSGINVTLFNCFVLNYIKDSRKGISRHRETTMEIMSRSGGVGSNGSTLRPRDAYVSGVNGKSSGADSWLNDLSRLTDLVQQGGSRRGAQMIGLADWHPDLIRFILCKIQNPYILDKITKEIQEPYIASVAESLLIRNEQGQPIDVHDADFMTGANISVLVSHDLMRAVEADEDWVLRFPDLENLTDEQKQYYDDEWHNIGDVRKWEAQGLPVKEYYTLKATQVFDLINIAARYSAEPGVIFIDQCNDMSNAWYYAPLVVTNPCGEQPLPADGVCNLLAINLARMADRVTRRVNYPLLNKVTRVSQRFSDNIIDHSFYFLPENEEMAKGERRVGKGVMGLADLMIDLQLPYGSEEMLAETDKIFDSIKIESYLASANIAAEKGSFPYYSEEQYLQSNFIQTLPDYVINEIKAKGIRNVCSLTVAPTGTTGTMIGVATSFEPYYAFTYFRTGRLGKFVEQRTAVAERYFVENPDATQLPDYYVSSQQIPALDHVRVQAVVQKHVDSSISKTCNAPKDFTVEQNKELYMLAWKLGCKGVTVYVDGSRSKQVLSTEATENEFSSNEDSSTTPEFLSLESITDEDLTADTRVCHISYDESGSMIKECV